MPSAHIEITGAPTRLSGHLRGFVDQLRRVQDTADHTKAVYDQIALGADYEALRDALGLEQDAQGTADAEAIYNLIGSVSAALDDAFVNQLIGRLG